MTSAPPAAPAAPQSRQRDAAEIDTATQLFGPDAAGAYLRAVTDAAGGVAAASLRATGPRSAATRPQLQALVDDVDLDRPLGTTAAALAEVGELYLDHAVWFHDPGYLAHLNCPVAVPALAAEVLASAVNTSVDTWDQSTSATLIEQRLIGWTASLIGFGGSADGVFTSGGTASNLHALLLAREETLARLQREGLPRDRALPRLRVLASARAHFSVAKAARLLGLSPDAVVTVGELPDRRLDPAALDAALHSVTQAGLVPAAVVATAGTTDLGLVDPLIGVAEVAREHGVWLHVDAAYGGALLLSERRRHLLAGLELADSVTVDFHKGFFQPVACSAIVVGDGARLRHAAWHADYLNPEGEDHPNLVDVSMQTTRRFDALKLWVTLRALGAPALGAMVDAVADLALDVHAALSARDDVEVGPRPALSTVLFRWLPPTGDDGATDPAARARAAERLVPGIRAALFDAGTAVVAKTRLDSEAWLKVTLLNPQVTLDDVLRAVDLVAAAGRELTSGVRA
ncbi:MAG: pyridoxal-dependent decarboxylase [Kineosporiaceae bacterium]